LGKAEAFLKGTMRELGLKMEGTERLFIVMLDGAVIADKGNLQ